MSKSADFSVPIVDVGSLINSALKKNSTPAIDEAFALADFDKDRILSREFFRNLNLPSADMSDKEFLKKSFDISNLDGAEKAIIELVEIREMVKKYRERLIKHSRKLEDFSKKIAYSIAEYGESEKLRKSFRRAKFLSEEYSKISKDYVAKLYHETQDKINSCDAIAGRYYRKKFSSKLKKIRKEKKMTQADLGRLLGIAQTGIFAYENAQREPSLSTLQRMAKILDVSPIEFF